jgi:hypothetical protein
MLYLQICDVFRADDAEPIIPADAFGAAEFKR